MAGSRGDGSVTPGARAGPAVGDQAHQGTPWGRGRSEQEGESMSSRLTHFCPLPATVVLAESTPVYIVMMLWTLLAK